MVRKRRYPIGPALGQDCIVRIGVISDANRERGIKAGPVEGLGIKPVGLNRPVELLRLSMGIVRRGWRLGRHGSGMGHGEIRKCLSWQRTANR